MYCENCGNKINKDAKFCSTCGKSVSHIEIKPTPAKKSDEEKNIEEIFKNKITKLKEYDLLPARETNNWEQGVFIGKAESNFCVNLPRDYDINRDVRLENVNAFCIKNTDHFFTVSGWEIPMVLKEKTASRLENFRESKNRYSDLIFSNLESQGIKFSKKDMTFLILGIDGFWWCRTMFSYKMDSSLYWKISGYNTFGKVLLKTLGFKKEMKKYKENWKDGYREYKVIDMFCFKKQSNSPFFCLDYTFDEISSKHLTGGHLNILNEISRSLRYCEE